MGIESRQYEGLTPSRFRERFEKPPSKIDNFCVPKRPKTYHFWVKMPQNRPKMALIVVYRNRMAMYRLLVVVEGNWRLVGVFGGANEHFTVQIDRFGPSRRGVQIVENGRKWSKMVVFCS